MRFAIVCLSLTIFAGVVHAEQVENPAFVLWRDFAVGSTTKVSGQNEAMGNKTDMMITTTVKDATPEKITLEIKTQIVAAGKTIDVPAQKQEIPRMVDKAQIGPNVPTSDAIAKASEETITVPAGTFKCKKVDISSSKNGMTITGTNYFSKEVPGGTVKMEMNTSGSIKSTTTMQLMAVEKK